MKIQFNQQCAGYLKQAADANTAELALERLNIAIKYVEDNNLTDGPTPDPNEETPAGGNGDDPNQGND